MAVDRHGVERLPYRNPKTTEDMVAFQKRCDALTERILADQQAQQEQYKSKLMNKSKVCDITFTKKERA